MLEIDEWALIAASFNSATQNVTFYFNGSYDNSSVISHGILYNYTANPSIGNTYEYDTKSADPLNGTIDRVCLFSRDLTEEELTFIYNSGDIRYYDELADVANATLNVEILNPPDHEISNLKLNVTYNVSQLSNCSIYIESALNQTSNNVNGVNSFYISDMDNDGTYYYYVYCENPDDNDTSESRHYHYHANSPLIYMTQPNHDNTTSLYNITAMEVIGYIINGNLTEVNETIRNSTTTLFQNDSSLLPTGTPLLNLSKIIDVSTWGTGTFYYDIYAIDEALNPSIENISFIITECVPSWECTGYGSCNTSDLQACNSTFDFNYCGVAYTGDYSEFSPVACNYCTASTIQISQSDCGFYVTGRQKTLYNYTNYAACCDLTGIPTDCDANYLFGVGNSSSFTSGTWALYIVDSDCSHFEYDAADAAPAIIDGIVKAIIAIVAFAALIGIILVISWIKRRVK